MYLFDNEIKVTQFADDTNLFRADLTSVEKGSDITIWRDFRTKIEY